MSPTALLQPLCAASFTLAAGAALLTDVLAAYAHAA